ncbi:STK33, partial [Symbiodinium pilosum]
AEVRRARKKEQMAKDPRRKVALRIERGRREADLERHKAAEEGEPTKTKASSKDKAIPLVEFIAPGCSIDNKEPVEVVDVLKIQRKCQGLGYHQSVSEMLKIRRWQEKTKKPSTRSMESSCSGSKFESCSWLFSSSVLDSVSLEERQAVAKERRDGQLAQKIRQKLRNMRSDCPLYLCRAYGMVDRNGNPMLGNDSRYDFSDSENESLGSSDEGLHSRRNSGEVFARKSTMRWGRGATQVMGKRASQQRRSSGGNNDKAKLEAITKKVRTCRIKMQATVQWLKILFHKRRRLAAADKCLALLRQIGEWVRMRSTMKKFVAHVKSIQQTIRSYLAMKRKRCHLIEKEWCRIEDLNLSVHAQYKAHLAMQEKNANGNNRESSPGKLRAKRRVLQAVMQASVSNKWKTVVDISTQRIPVAERRAIIASYHRRAIRRHMHIGKTFLQVVWDALRASRELDQFLNQFHYDSSGSLEREKFKFLEVKKEDIHIEYQDQDLLYWQMSEAVIIQLVACSAQALVHASNFKEHPANQAIPVEKRKEWPEYVIGSDPYEFAEFVLLQLDRPFYHGRFGQPPTMRASDIMEMEVIRNERKLIEGKFMQSRFLKSGGTRFEKGEDDEAIPLEEIRDVDQALSLFGTTRARSKESNKELGSLEVKNQTG